MLNLTGGSAQANLGFDLNVFLSNTAKTITTAQPDGKYNANKAYGDNITLNSNKGARRLFVSIIWKSYDLKVNRKLMSATVDWKQ